MEEKELLSQLISLSYTKTDITRRLRILREFFEQKYYSSGGRSLEEFLKTAKCTKEDSGMLLSLDSKFYKNFTKSNTYPCLAKLDRLLNKEEVIHVYLPYEPMAEEKEKIGSWFKKNISKNVILDIQVDSSITLGCAFAYKGIYHNFSLKYFMDIKRGEISQLLDKYVQNP